MASSEQHVAVHLEPPEHGMGCDLGQACPWYLISVNFTLLCSVLTNITIIWVCPAQVVGVIFMARYCILWTAEAICYGTRGAVILLRRLKICAVWSAQTRNGVRGGTGDSYSSTKFWKQTTTLTDLSWALPYLGWAWHLKPDLFSLQATEFSGQHMPSFTSSALQ